VSPRQLPGAWLKIRILNSDVVLQNLVKCVKNYRIFRKMQTQFVGLLVKTLQLV
jgi:hypothetical protein